jgi:hypothetical protein
VADPRHFPPEIVVTVKALACELPSRLGVPLSRWHVPDLAKEVKACGLVADISGTAIWRWLSADVSTVTAFSPQAAMRTPRGRPREVPANGHWFSPAT